MNRRSLLLSLGTGIGVAISGCTNTGDSSESSPTSSESITTTTPGSTPSISKTGTETPSESIPTATETATATPSAAPPSASVLETEYLNHIMYRLDGTMLSADPPEGWSVDDPVAFADLSAEYQLAVANGITRTQYVGLPRPPEVPEGVRYQGETFHVHYSVSDYWGTPYETPGGSEWRAPLSLSADVEDGSFVVSVTNELDEPFPVHHFPRPSPYFGVLVAVSDEPQVLPHDGYDAIEALRTEGVVRIPSDEYWALKRRDRRPSTETGGRSTATEEIPSSDTVLERQQKDHVTWLDPGESVRESYELPTDLPPESTVWLSLPVGDESTEVTGGRTWQFTATVRLHVR